ncbi:MAG: FG-GAP-like repeat-containing protein, partial [Saprospiraceae bacterium]
MNFTLANPQPNLMEVYSGTFASGDVDGDGDIDLFMTGITPQKQTKLYLNNGTGNFTEVANTPFPRSGSSQAILKDLDNDGDLDLFFSGNNLLSQNFTHIYRNNGSGIFTQVTNNALPAFIKGAAIADVDNDGDQDLVISTSTVADVFLNNGNAVFSAQGSSVFTPVSGVVQFIDMENDGDQDVIISGASSIKLYQNNGSGNFTLNTNSTFAALSGSDIDVADTDNDGDLDFLINGSGSGGQNLLYINNGSGIFTQIATTLQQTFGGQNAISDLDNDGDQDILIVGTQAGGLPNIFNIVYRNTGNNVFVQTQILGGEYIADCAVADFTGDGLKDIIIQGFVDNTNAYWNTSTTACTPPNAPTGTLAITNSTCSACVVGGGSIAIGTVSGTGGTLEYSTNGGASWSATLPTYNQTGPAQTILASVLAANECRSNATQVGVTVPGTCTTPNAPTGTLAITNSTCSACVVGGGSIAIGTVSGTGGTLEYSTNGGASWSTTLPPYNQTGPAQTILASVLATSGCRSNATQVGVTVPGQCPAPDAPTGTLNIVNSTCSACIVGGGSITIGTVSGTGGTLEYSTNGGVNWSATLPTYNQTGPTQTILASVVDINGCRSTTTQVGVMVPGTCTTPNAPTGTLAIINSTCSNCVVGGGSISIGTVSGTGGTLEFSTNGGASWSATLPTYNQTGPAQTILASVLATSGCRSNATQVGVTVPGTCTTPNAPTGTLAITNSTCSNCVVGGGSISIGTVSGTGGTLEYSTNGGASWSATLPTYNQTGPAQTIIASVLAANGCRSNATQVG